MKDTRLSSDTMSTCKVQNNAINISVAESKACSCILVKNFAYQKAPWLSGRLCQYSSHTEMKSCPSAGATWQWVFTLWPFNTCKLPPFQATLEKLKKNHELGLLTAATVGLLWDLFGGLTLAPDTRYKREALKTVAQLPESHVYSYSLLF